LPDYKIVRLGIARTFQNTRVFSNMTVLENVMLGQHTHSRAGFLSTALRLPAMRSEERRIREVAMASLEFVGLKDFRDVPADTLPFKQQRLLELARAYSLNPRLMLIDEPAAGLNARETKEIATLIQRINAAGITVLLVEHDMSLVMNISDEVLVLDCGRKIAEGTPGEIRRNQEVIDIYLGRRSRDAENPEYPRRL
ncbi:MAG: ATP-binding cassette domain-containing protein, partial [Candidatus Sumerlaeia bacterium]|nr:ATP-binding cassette domain-containing protein [Candidatus Sumerlaeia bacterium]